MHVVSDHIRLFKINWIDIIAFCVYMHVYMCVCAYECVCIPL